MSNGGYEQENGVGVKCAHVGYNIGEKYLEHMEYMEEEEVEMGGGS